MREGTANPKSTRQTTGNDSPSSKSPARVPVGSLRSSGENNGGQAALPDSAGRLPACQDSLAGYHPSKAGNLDLRETTMRLVRRENLSRTEAANFLDALLDPIATDTQIAAALIALTAKGETVDELAGMAEAMRERATPLHSRHERFIDTAGTGSSAAKRFNVSTAAAFVIAGAGLPVAKHGARAVNIDVAEAPICSKRWVSTLPRLRKSWNAASMTTKFVSSLRRFSIVQPLVSRMCAAN